MPQVTEKVIKRQSFIAPVMFYMYLNRAEQYEFSNVFEVSNVAFCMKSPELKPRWEGLVDPLNIEIWLALLVMLLLMPVLLALVRKS